MPSRHIPTRLSLQLLAGLLLLAGPALGADIPTRTTADQPPRKVIVGSVMQPLWGKHPGLQKRLDQLTTIIDRMQAESEQKYGRGLDLAILPEIAISGEIDDPGDVSIYAFPLKGPVQDAFAREARKCHCYIVATTYLLEDRATKRCSNAAILFDRSGAVEGIYRKVHLVVDGPDGRMERGSVPGKDEPVFQCDFGKLGIQICYDMDFASGWRELARRGAELVAWPSQSPQTSQPATRARENRYYIVSSTWRHNASVFEPTGKIVAQVLWPPSAKTVPAAERVAPANNILVQEIDLSYAILPWSAPLKHGDGLKEIYGDKVGFRYYEDEDLGMFWSNDPHITIGQMMRKLGLEEAQDEYQRAEEVYRKAGVPSN
jgi:predicted amidohydrolase